GFAAGIPLKILHAAAHGLPIVSTSLLANQLGWSHERELLVGDTIDDFAACCARLSTDESLWRRLRAAALDRVAADCSRTRFMSGLETALSAAAGRRAAKIPTALRERSPTFSR